MADKNPQPSAAKRPAGPHPAPRREGEQIIFYCPNGDRIVVAAALGGKTGLCTKCRVQVSIPAIEPAPTTAEPAPADMQAGFPLSVPGEAPALVSDMGPLLPDAQPRGTPPAAAPPVDWDLVAGQSVAAVIPELAELDETAPEEPFSGPSPAPGPDHHPAARLVARLWQERAHGGIIELHMAGGSVILPEFYEPNWSRGTHGLFASQAADGTVTLTAVAWETVLKIVVRQLTAVPDDMFT
jgi:hypothetical protein